MTVKVTKEDFKHLFAEVITDSLRTEIGDVTYFSILHFVEKQYDTLIKNAVDMTKELYLASEQYRADVEIMIEQIIYLAKIDLCDIEDCINYKLERQMKRIEAEQE